MPINYVLLGRNVHRLRREMGWTQEELAVRIRKSASFVGHIERGTRFASMETLVDLAEALQTTPDRLLGCYASYKPTDIAEIRRCLEKAATLLNALDAQEQGAIEAPEKE